MTGATRGRHYAVALILLIAGSALLLVAYGMTWATADVPLLTGSADAVRQREITGQDLFPWAAMAGWVALAAVAGIVATRSWGRVVVAAFGVIGAGVGAAGAVAFAASSSGAIDAVVGAEAGMALTVSAQASPAWILALAGALLALVGAGWTMARGRSWPSLGRRYERSPSARRGLSDWEALDVGQDPTDDLVE